MSRKEENYQRMWLKLAALTNAEAAVQVAIDPWLGLPFLECLFVPHSSEHQTATPSLINLLSLPVERSLMVLNEEALFGSICGFCHGFKIRDHNPSDNYTHCVVAGKWIGVTLSHEGDVASHFLKITIT
jgi:hypothetical protein